MTADQNGDGADRASLQQEENAMSKLGEHISPRNGIWLRRFSANVSKFVRMMALPVSSLSAFKSCAEILPAKPGMVYGNW